MFDLKTELMKIVKGDVEDTASALDIYSHDASLLEVRPKIVVFPKDSQDIKAVVKFVSENKKHDESLSVTVRAAGTCMSGGPLNESIILDVTRYMKGVVAIDKFEATVLPGTMYRDFEVETLKYNSILPCYTASKNLNALGGMVGNNSAGEKTLKYGKMEDYVKELKVCLLYTSDAADDM
jgi:FAD/FMN-containing dehydrogenase